MDDLFDRAGNDILKAEITILNDRIGQLEREVEGWLQRYKDIFMLSVSEYCARYQYQNCSCCEKATCGDNTNPLVTENATLQDRIEQLEREVGKAKAENQSFGNVLALIHRDGGHYITKHGHEKASKDAIKIVLGLEESLGHSIAYRLRSKDDFVTFIKQALGHE